MYDFCSYLLFWSLLQIIISNFYQGKNKYKISGNILSMLNGSMIISMGFLPLSYTHTILKINAAYNINDMILASNMFRMHHIFVLMFDYLIYYINPFAMHLAVIVFSLFDVCFS